MEEIIYIYFKSVETTYLEEMNGNFRLSKEMGGKFPVSFKYADNADKEKR